LRFASPCLSSFVPVWHDSGQPEGWEQPLERSNRDAWWNMERMQRRIEQDYGRLAKAPQAIFAALESGDAGRPCAASRRMRSAGHARRPDAKHRKTQEVACRIVNAMTKDCADEVVTPRRDDPRGNYLQRVEAERVARCGANSAMLHR